MRPRTIGFGLVVDAVGVGGGGDMLHAKNSSLWSSFWILMDI